MSSKSFILKPKRSSLSSSTTSIPRADSSSYRRVAYAICANVHENPSKEVVMEAAACAKANGCDFVLAVGGGAVLDSAVAVAAMATNPGDLWDYVCGGTGKCQPLQHPA